MHRILHPCLILGLLVVLGGTMGCQSGAVSPPPTPAPTHTGVVATATLLSPATMVAPTPSTTTSATATTITEEETPAVSASDAPYTFTLHVLNASPTDATIPIQVLLDEQMVVSDTFVNQDELLSIIPHKTYEFQLAGGQHHIQATALHNNAVLDTTFDMAGPRWAILGYAYWNGVTGTPTPPDQFELFLQETPVLFE